MRLVAKVAEMLAQVSLPAGGKKKTGTQLMQISRPAQESNSRACRPACPFPANSLPRRGRVVGRHVVVVRAVGFEAVRVAAVARQLVDDETLTVGGEGEE